jgi:hypothetical protein
VVGDVVPAPAAAVAAASEATNEVPSAGWMFAAARRASVRERGRNTTAPGAGITMPYCAAIRSIR